MQCITNITISGFDGAYIQSNEVSTLDEVRVRTGVNRTLMDHAFLRVLPLLGHNASIFSNVTWSPERSSVRMRCTGEMGGDNATDVIFSFVVTNPVEAQPSPLIEIEADGIPISRTRMVKDNQPPSNSLYDHAITLGLWNDSSVSWVGSPNGALFNATYRDAEPLRVHTPAFVVKTIGQSSPYPGANNTIGITISPNIDLDVGSVIAISMLNNLDGTEAASTGPISLSDGDTHTNGKSTADDTRYFAASTGGMSGSGLWDQDESVVSLFVVSKLTAGSFYSFKFVLKNALCTQPPQPVCIRARNLDVGYVSGVVIPRRTMEHDVKTLLSVYDAAVGDAAPLLVYQPRIVVSTMIHSTPWPSFLNNTVTVTFVTNVPLLRSSFAPKITLSNLVQTMTSSGLLSVTIQKEGSASSVVSGTWDQGLGQLTFAPSDDTTPGANYTVSFFLTNRHCQQNAPATTINISGVCFAGKPVEPLVASHCNMDTQPLQVLGGPCDGQSSSAIFTLKNISQSTPYPGDTKKEGKHAHANTHTNTCTYTQAHTHTNT